MTPSSPSQGFLPASRREVRERGWDEPDVVLVTGDAYVDHPAFGAALVGRFLQSLGLRVAVLPQPSPRDPRAFQSLGRPALFFGVTAGNLDSRLAARTAQRKVRNRDAYSPGGRPGLRPELASLAYAQACRRAFPGVPVILGGVEAGLRRIAHYDHWSDRVRGPLLLDAKADLLVHGMAEAPLRDIVAGLVRGRALSEMRRVPGTAYALGASELPGAVPPAAVELPGLEEVRHDPAAFARMTRLVYQHRNPGCARPLVQRAGTRAVVVNPPAAPLDAAELDSLYELPFLRRAHPSAGEGVPALETVRHSITAVRGCFGGCSFCSLSLHQGSRIQSRSPGSVLREIDALARLPGWKGVVTDLGGPSANMYGLGCSEPDREKRCRRASCLWPRPCAHLRTDHGPYRDLLEAAAGHPAVRKVFVQSGVRMDLALEDPAFIEALARRHVGGLLSVAPEHSEEEVLRRMRKPSWEVFLRFREAFERASRRAGKVQHLDLYLMAGHPGSRVEHARALARRLRREGLRPRKVQEFVPLPMTEAACLHHAGLDPFTGRPVTRSRKLSETRRKKDIVLGRQGGARGARQG